MTSGILKTSPPCGSLGNELCIVTFIYKDFLDEDEKLALIQISNNLSGYKLYIVVPDNLDQANLKSFTAEHFITRPQFLSVDHKHLSSVASYNAMLKELWFYKLFAKYQYILICQLDVLVLGSDLSTWTSLSYSYIGAPWFGELFRAAPPHPYVGIGNGGFSLRRTSDFMFVLSNLRFTRQSVLSTHELLIYYMATANCHFCLRCIYALSMTVCTRMTLSNNLSQFAKSKLNEDIFWGLLVPRVFSWFTVPRPSLAAQFSLETDLPEALDLYQISSPLGIHAWSKYHRAFVIEAFRNLLHRDCIN